MTKTKKNVLKVGQDWASVISGFALILLLLFAGYKIKIPAFGGKAGWADYTALSADLYSQSLLISISATFALFMLIAIIGL